ncbi:MAG: tRNA lysidine(34) synthetase TilS [Limnochordia bacterium]|nr:tRNA lysidine(34) synthetase TilS [Limnochordia bacterium]
MDRDLYPVFMRNLKKLSVTQQDRILVAVSGGPDSMVLLHLLWRFNARRIGVFHLNHGFREAASEDARFVGEYADKLGVPAQIESYDIMGFLATSGESKQQGARKIRYQLLRNFAEANGYHRIALGHHGDDQAETVLMRMLRGAGLHGLGGIPPERGPFIRPLLDFYKEDLLQYCTDFDIPFVLDESNFQPVYVRNKVRQELLPLLAAEYNPEIIPQLVQLAELAREDELELHQRAKEITLGHLKWRWGQVLFPRRVFAGLSVAMQRRVLRGLLQTYKGNLLQVGFVHIEDWRKMLAENSSFRLSLPGCLVAATSEYVIVGEFAVKPWGPTELHPPGQIRVGHFTIQAEIYAKDDLDLPGEDCEDFDLDTLALPLVVRPRRAGDRMRPFGGGGSKKVKDLLIDCHVPLDQRDFLPLVCDQQDVLWIPTVRRGSKGSITETTNRVLRLRLK